MFKSYFKIAWRNLVRNKLYSSINIIGLAAGMTVALLIGLWIVDELSFDHYHTNHKRIAQVMSTNTFNGETHTQSAIPIPLGAELLNKYAGDFKRLALTTYSADHILTVGEKQIVETGMWAPPEFAEMLSLKMVRGSVAGLADPSSMLLTESLAKAVFGNGDPLGKVMHIDNNVDMKVAGVYKDLPQNTTFADTKLLLPWSKYVSQQPKDVVTLWGYHTVQLFVQLEGQADAGKLNGKIKNIAKEHSTDSKEELVLQPMDNWRLYSNFENGRVTGGRIQFVWLFGIIGAFVLLLACINFMNLSTARSEKRAKEVGIRKAIGSLRSQLIGQFLCESMVMAFLALVIALVAAWQLLPFFNRLADKQMFIPWTNPLFGLLLAAFTLFTGFASGSYPAFYLSGFQPIKVLKGVFRVGRWASLPRKTLVVVQFTVSVTLIIGTVVVFRQVQYAKNRPVGYAREGLITVKTYGGNIAGHYNAIRSDLLQTGAVEDMSLSSSPSTGIYNHFGGIDWIGKDPNQAAALGAIAVTHDFGRTVGWQILEGRDFSRNSPADTGAFILNEAALRLTGLKDPIGKVIKWNGQPHLITGIVKDMVMESPYKPADPTFFTLDYGSSSLVSVRINPALPLREALAKIETVFRKYNPGSPFEYRFTDEEYAKKFSDEERIGNLANIFALLAIFISCLGLFGLASFIAEQRTKEIGLRKVMGATVFNLWRLLSKEFLVLVILSCMIASPIAWYFLSNWLMKYEYHTPLSWWIFAMVGLGALGITLLTVSYQGIKAALMNPVNSLRTE